MQLDPRIRSWLETVALPGTKVVAAQPLSGGYSNDNCRIDTADGRRFVLRRYLRRNSCVVKAALAQRLTGVVRVPEVIAFDPNGSRAGEPVLLSTYVPGQLLGQVLPGLPGPQAEELGRWRVAAVLHWEFAFSSTPLFDVGNMLRGPRPGAFQDGFVAGFQDNGAVLPRTGGPSSGPWTCTRWPTC